MISGFVNVCPTINKKYCKYCALRSNYRNVPIHHGYRVYLYMSQTNGEESSEQQKVSPVNEATSYKEKKLEEYDSSQTTEQTRTSFKYIPGAQGKVDVWFIIGLLIFAIPIVAIAWGISTGVIDLSAT
ncbi:hypothetical protein GAYE_PCTG50G1198 [Galdieria yellowstonensis]|uniref:Uncharacterized protein n=1 Tax=Galdieria yellowstonensis TaxID=3028027 RepID=A0AAV9I726_9RHOD|nr:hypothetical protein GAYE_PCTG50G1198 [Galdieria yellowstonensis]